MNQENEIMDIALKLLDIANLYLIDYCETHDVYVLSDGEINQIQDENEKENAKYLKETDDFLKGASDIIEKYKQQVNIKMDEELLDVVKMFMKENDRQALEKLYDITNDSSVKLLIEWNEEYNEFIHEPNTYAGNMYEDLMSCIWNKYNLNEVEEIINKEKISLDDEKGKYSNIIDNCKDEIKNNDNMEVYKKFFKVFKAYYNDLNDLSKRLQDDYNSERPFEQDEQDRLALCMLCDLFDAIEVGDNNNELFEVFDIESQNNEIEEENEL